MGTQAQTGLPELCSPCGAPLPPDPTATSPTASVPASGIYRNSNPGFSLKSKNKLCHVDPTHQDNFASLLIVPRTLHCANNRAILSMNSHPRGNIS